MAMKFDSERAIGNKCLISSFCGWIGEKYIFANLSRVVIEGFSGLGKRLERHDDGSWTDLKNLHESCSMRSARLCTAA